MLPVLARKTCRHVNAIPIGRVVARKMALGPFDPELAKHGDIGARIRLIGIEKRAIPVEQDGARGKAQWIHDRGIVAKKWESVAVVARGHRIIAAQGKIIKSSCVAAPSRHVDFVGSHDVGRRAHLDAAHARRSVNERHFQLDGSSSGNFARREKINAARADVASYETLAGLSGDHEKPRWHGWEHAQSVVGRASAHS